MIQRVRVENDRLLQEVLQLREEIRIKDARMAFIPAHQRPRYRPVERMAILELRAGRGWSLEQTARVFLVTAATISTWLRRLEEEGPDALVQLPQPVNKFPELVHHLVQRLKTLCPTLGKRKIAQALARAGLHLGATTVARMIKAPPPPPQPVPPEKSGKPLVPTARRPTTVWCNWQARQHRGGRAADSHAERAARFTRARADVARVVLPRAQSDCRVVQRTSTARDLGRPDA
jgi:transposase